MADIKRSAENLKNNVVDAAKNSKEYIEQQLHELNENGVQPMKKDLEKKAYAYGNKARHALDDAEDKAKSLMWDVEQQVRVHPLYAIGGAFLLGWLLGKIK